MTIYQQIAKRRIRNLKMHNHTNVSFYLSGKITGFTKEQYEQNFSQSWYKLIYTHYFSLDDIVINPCNLIPFLGIKTWFFHMITDVFNLLKSDAVVFQDNWNDSKGAKIEMWFALLFNKIIILQ